MLDTVGRYYRTLRYLKMRQIGFRLYRALRPAPALSMPVCQVADSHSHCGKWASNIPSMIGPTDLSLLNCTVSLNSEAAWNDQSLPRLLQYNIHYFDDLTATGATERVDWHRDLIDRWIVENPPGSEPGWEPYPTSMRIVNWVKWSLGPGRLSQTQVQSLALQAEWLSKNIEYHLLGNHLFANAKALLFAGAYLCGRRPRAWVETAVDILGREVKEQVLADGAHFELSTMYHCICLEDVLDIVNLSRALNLGHVISRIGDLKFMAERMLDWLDAMCHPDGEMSLFNDSAFGIAPNARELRAYAARLGIDRAGAEATVYLPESGYARVQKGHATLLADIGEIGPSYLPGHAHADTLSFELSVFGDRFIVDPGCSTYDVGEERLRQRGTGAHNTVIVNDSDSSEVWASFRVGRRAKPYGQRVEEGPEKIVVTAGHDGYRRFGRDIRHERKWEVFDDKIVISDWVSGTHGRNEARILLHPDVRVTVNGAQGELRGRRGTVGILVDGGQLEVAKSTWHPEFGAKIPTWQLRIPFRHGTLKTTLSWPKLDH